MIRKYVLPWIILLSCLQSIQGQNIEEISKIYELEGATVSAFSVQRDEKDNTYVIYLIFFGGKISIDNEYFADTTGCYECYYTLAAKYDQDNKLINVLKFSSTVNPETNQGQGLHYPTIHLVNDKVFIGGDWRGNILLDGELISGPSLVDSSNFHGILLQLDTDLGLEKISKFSKDALVRGVVYDASQHQYIIGGQYFGPEFQYLDLKLTTGGDYNSAFYSKDIFIVKVDEFTGLPIDGISYGGPDVTTLDAMHMDDSGNLILGGGAAQPFLKIKDTYIILNASTYNDDLYILKLNQDFDYVSIAHFNYIKNTIYFNGMIYEPANDEVYLKINGGTKGGFNLNGNSYFEELNEDQNYLVKLKNINELDWVIHFETVDTNHYNGFIPERISLDDFGNLYVAGSYRRPFKINGEEIISTNFNGRNSGMILKVDASNGQLDSVINFFPEMATSFENLYVKKDNSLSVLATLWLPTSLNIADLPMFMQDWITTKMEYILVDFSLDYVSHNKELEVMKDMFIYPNPTDDYITLTGLDNSHKYKYDVISATGEYLLKAIDLTNEQIDCTFLPTGYYILVIKDVNTGHLFSEKVIVK